MALLDRLLGRKEERNLNPDAGWMSGILAQNLSGSDITSDTALTLSTVYACVSKISTTVASIDKNVYKRAKRGKDFQQEHPLFGILNESADFQTPSFTFWENIISDSMLYGKGYAYIERDGSTKRPISLVSMPAPQVTAFKDPKGRRRYAYAQLDKDGRRTSTLELDNDSVICISAFRGMSPIELHRQNLGLAKSAENYGASFFGSGGHLSGILKLDKSLTDEQYQTLKSQWNMAYHGTQSNHATAILEHGIEYEKFGIPPDQAQFIETRKMQSQEIARIFGVPASIVGLESNLNYNSVEQQAQFFATFTIAPLVKRIENELNTKLMSEGESGRYFIEFDLSSLLRGDNQSRATYISTLIRDGVMTVNEARQVEGLNPVEGGDLNLIQSNLIPLDKAEEFGEKLVKPAPEPVLEPSEDVSEDSEGDTPEDREEAQEESQNTK